jgi:protein SCO1/2
MSTVLKGLPRAHDRRNAAVLIFALVALSAVPLIALYHAFGPKPDRAPDFTLTDQAGRPFTLSALRGAPVVLFFGYTHCPDTCPATLAKLARAVRSPAAPRDVRIAFITVDPERDSPRVLARYLRLFDPQFIGLTGTFQTLDPVYSAYHTWRQDIPVHHEGADYFVAHGASLYYIGRSGAIRGYGTWTDDTPLIIHHLKEFQ